MLEKDNEIETFLYGHNESEELKYITAIEGNQFNNKVTLFRELPGGRKVMDEDTYIPFVYMKDPLANGVNFKSHGSLGALKREHGIELSLLNTGGYERMEKGYKYRVTSSKSMFDIVQFFKALGIKVWWNDFFYYLKPDEQYLVQKGVRLFRGMELYNDLHKLYWDIETQGLDPKRHRVFMIGLRDNRGYEEILVVDKENDDYEEKRLILTFWYKLFNEINPSMIIGFNSENFDFYFILERANLLGIDLEKLQTTRDYTGKIKLKRQKATLKLGNETEEYEKTVIWGMLNADLHHAVRKAKAIDSSIKKTGLKYIVKHKKVSKKDRMYIADGRNIAKFWFANENFIADEGNTYFRIPDEYQISPDAFFEMIAHKPSYLEENTWFGHKEMFEGEGWWEKLRIITGQQITFRYLQDDLWETEQVDKIFNEATFLMGKMFPTNYERTSSMGNSAVWNLLMTTWSYEKGLAIPIGTKKRKFVGGLSRVILVGFAKRILKLDYSALYPSIELTHLVFPEFDFTHALFRILRYLKLNRDHFKALSGDKSLEELERAFYKVKQLPLKILNNSNFGAMGSEYMNWADMDLAERITCTGRQYLRVMTYFFMRWGLKPLVCDSVTGDTPVYIKYQNGDIDIQPISDLFDEKSENKSDDGLRDFSEKPYQVLTRNGWKKIGYVYRHGTNKQLRKVQTGNRQIKVTEDHSLFQHGVEVKPKDLKVGDLLDVYDLPIKNDGLVDPSLPVPLDESSAFVFGFFLGGNSEDIESAALHLSMINKTGLSINELEVYLKGNEFFTNEGKARVPKWIINAPLEIKKRFFNGLMSGKNSSLSGKIDSDVAIAGIFMLQGAINEPMIRMVSGEGRGIVTKNEILPSEEYVYDISTEDGTFIAGIGGIIAHNTDGFNFVVPETVDKGIDLNQLPAPVKIEELSYVTKDGKTYTGTAALVEKFNDEVMWGPFMKLDNDGEWVSCINVAKKNYANLEEDGSIKYTGNTIKSSTMPDYIENFLDKALTMILKEQPVEFVEYYYSYLEKVANCEIPLSQIASKGKVKKGVMEYIDRGFDTSGKYLPKQAHMELIMETHMEEADYKGLSKWLEIHVDLQGPKCLTALSKINHLTDPEEVFKKLGKKRERFMKFLYEIIQEKGVNKGIGLQKALLEVKKKDFTPEMEDKVKKETKNAYLIETDVFTVKKSIIKEAVNRSGEELDNYKAKAKEIKFPYDLGDMIFYINVANSKAVSDSSWDTTGRLNVRMVSADYIEKNPEKTGEYNILKYVDAFNSRITTLLICFNKEVRDTLIKNVAKVKNKLSKTGFDYILEEREYYTSDQLVLQNEIKDTVEELLHMGEDEVKFWNLTKLDPREIFPGFTHSQPLWYEEENIPCRSREEIIKESTFEQVVVSGKETDDEEYEYCLVKLQAFFYQRGGGTRIELYRNLQEVVDRQNAMVLIREASGINLYSIRESGDLAFEKTIKPSFYKINKEQIETA